VGQWETLTKDEWNLMNGHSEKSRHRP
jgi:hypothetical protein